MTMTRKDFTLIAAALNDVRPVRTDYLTGGAYQIAWGKWDQTRNHLASRLEYAHPAFRIDRFIAATEGK